MVKVENYGTSKGPCRGQTTTNRENADGYSIRHDGPGWRQPLATQPRAMVHRTVDPGVAVDAPTHAATFRQPDNTRTWSAIPNAAPCKSWLQGQAVGASTPAASPRHSPPAAPWSTGNEHNDLHPRTYGRPESRDAANKVPNLHNAPFEKTTLYQRLTESSRNSEAKYVCLSLTAGSTPTTERTEQRPRGTNHDARAVYDVHRQEAFERGQLRDSTSAASSTSTAMKSATPRRGVTLEQVGGWG